MKLQLRDYQREAIDALELAWSEGMQRPAVVLPTGAGKTVVFSDLADSWAAKGRRVLVLVHRDELARQTVSKLRATNDQLHVGRVQAKHNDVHAKVVVASIQTVQRAARLAQLMAYGRFALVICDEAHRAASDQWLKVLRGLGCFEPGSGVVAAGFTATMSRADKRGLGDVWDEVVYSRGLRYFIERGYLVRPLGKSIAAVDLRGVRKQAGDYSEAELGVKMATHTMREAIVRGYVEHAIDRQGVVFAPTIASAEFFAEGLRAAGIVTEGIYATTSLPERQGIYERLRRGDVQVLTSCTALAEGWDEPQVSCAVLARPTLHAGLYIQQIGRVLRPWPGKRDALVLDAAGASVAHSLEALIELHETPPPTDKTDEDLLDEIEDGDAPDTEGRKYSGRTVFVDVDLWAGTGARWLTTSGGVLFVPVGDRLVFLLAQGTSWGVGICEGWTMEKGEWLRQGLTSEQALAWASQWATDNDPTRAGAHASWRKAKAPSIAQLGYAGRLGIVDAHAMSKSELSDAISTKLASATLRSIGNGN